MINFPKFIPGDWPVYCIAAASVCGALFLAFDLEDARRLIYGDKWSLQYLLLSPFVHSGAPHLILNIAGLHYIGGQMVLPLLGAHRFLILFFACALAGGVVNNVLGDYPAVGISGAVLGMLACSLHRFAYAPMRLLLLHDVLRLRPFPLWKAAAFIVVLDIAGVVFGWQFFAHWAHLAGFFVGGIVGFFFFRLPPHRRAKFRRTLH